MPHYEKLLEITRAMQPEQRAIRSFHVSFIMRRNQFVAIACNCNKTHPINLRNPSRDEEGKKIAVKFTCSELAAFVKAKRKTNIDLTKCTLINFRLKDDGSVGLSKPCESCQSLINHARFKRVFYSTEIEGELLEWNFQKKN